MGNKLEIKRLTRLPVVKHKRDVKLFASNLRNTDDENFLKSNAVHGTPVDRHYHREITTSKRVHQIELAQRTAR